MLHLDWLVYTGVKRTQNPRSREPGFDQGVSDYHRLYKKSGQKLTRLLCLQDQDAIDFTDNDIAQLGNFPLNPRLQALYLGRNRVGSIVPGLAKSIPNVSCIVLTQNQLSELADLEPLLELPKLTHLSLLENPVSAKEVRVACVSVVRSWES